MSAKAQCNIVLSGKITDADTKKPLENAVIAIVELNKKVVSDKNGNYRLTEICKGNYNISIQHIHCGTIVNHVHINNNTAQNFALPHTVNELEGVVVNGTVAAKGTQILTELKQKALDATRGTSLGEALQKIAGVNVLQTGANIYKPIIHGLHSNRVLILNNGIRQEGQQWGSEHAPEIDPFIANRLSVIKGASAIKYGADAIGGVVLVEPKLLRTVPGIGGEINLVGFSNNRQGVFSAIIDGNSKKYPAFSWRLQNTIKRGGNARTPNYWLDNSGNQEINFSVAAALQKQKSAVEIFYSFFSTKLAIFSGSHIGNVTDLLTAISSNQPPDYIKNVGFSYAIDRPYQNVQHQLLKLKAHTLTGSLGKLNAIVSFQNNWRREFDKKRFQSSSNDPQLDLNISTLATDIVWDHTSTHHVKGSVGITGSYQQNSYQYRLFIPNYEALNVGAFIVEKYTRKKWLAEVGIRFDNRSIFNTNSNLGRLYTNQTYSSFSGNMGVSYQIAEGTQFTANASSAWRAPQVNELYSDGLHHGAARIEKGDSSLQAERANSVMANFTIQKKRWSADIAVYYKKIDDFIYLYPVNPPELTIRGAFPTFKYAQANIFMYGIDASVSYDISSHFGWSGKATIVRAKNRTTKEWMIQMPADRFENALQYNFSNSKRINDGYAKWSITNVLQQTRVPQTGNIPVTKNGVTTMESDYLAPPPAYFLVGIETGAVYKVKENTPIHFTITISNLFNTVYREYLNAFRYYADEMGTNVGLKVKIPLFNKS